MDQLGEKQQKLLEMRDVVRVLQDYLRLNKKQVELEAESKTKEEEYQEIREQYEKLEEAWVSGQASILATHLHDGKPCPVCGSSEHPSKAQGQDSVPTKDQLESIKKELDIKDSDYRSSVALLNTNKEQLESRAAEVIELGLLVQDAQLTYNGLVEEGQRLKNDVDALGKEKVKLARLKEDLEKKEEEVETIRRETREKATAFQELNTAFETKKAVYTAQISRIPDEIRNLAVLEQKITETQAEKTKLEQAWETAQNRLQLAKEEETKATANVFNAKNQLQESSEKKEKCGETVFTSIATCKFCDGGYVPTGKNV